MPKVDVAAIRARCNAATPGPWRTKRDRNEQMNVYANRGEWVDANWIALLPHQGVRSIEEEQNRNADFISRARTDVPALLGRIEELERVERAARAFVKAADEVAEWSKPGLQGFDRGVVEQGNRLKSAIDAAWAELRAALEAAGGSNG